MKIIEFITDHDDIIIRISIKLSISEFLKRVSDIYQYALKYSDDISQEKAKEIRQDNMDSSDTLWDIVCNNKSLTRRLKAKDNDEA